MGVLRSGEAGGTLRTECENDMSNEHKHFNLFNPDANYDFVGRRRLYYALTSIGNLTMLGLVAATFIFGRRAERAAYAQIEGQPGAAAAALGSLRSGWELEAERLKRFNNGVWSTDNENLQSWAMSVVLFGGLLIAFGVVLPPWILAHVPAGM